jgi:Mlc titration factor MtfA (ptsG expression regulator)
MIVSIFDRQPLHPIVKEHALIRSVLLSCPMTTQAIISLVALLLILVAVVFRVLFWPHMRITRIQKRAFPESWHQTLIDRLPFVARVPLAEQEQLKFLIKVFLADKEFYGCAGQEIDDDIRVTVAAQACLLLLNQDRTPYPNLDSILIYPSTFVATREVANELGLVSTNHIAMLGESWSQGKVVLAWDNVKKGVMNLQDGQNVVLHEFAHQLDHESGSTNGAPVLNTRGAYRSWAHVFSEEFEELQKDAMRGRHSLLDHYGATNPAEFFAVATETFFERPKEMAAYHQELYQQLKDYYKLDPEEWQQP